MRDPVLTVVTLVHKRQKLTWQVVPACAGACSARALLVPTPRCVITRVEGLQFPWCMTTAMAQWNFLWDRSFAITMIRCCVCVCILWRYNCYHGNRSLTGLGSVSEPFSGVHEYNLYLWCVTRGLSRISSLVIFSKILYYVTFDHGRFLSALISVTCRWYSALSAEFSFTGTLFYSLVCDLYFLKMWTWCGLIAL